MPQWIKPLTKKQANPKCGCVWDITGLYMLWTCSKHAPKPRRRAQARRKAVQP